MSNRQNDIFDLTGRHAVVTGAGGAIGRAVSVGLARQGAKVVMVDIREEPLLEAAKEVEGEGEAVVVVGDTSRPEGAAAIVDEVSRRGAERRNPFQQRRSGFAYLAGADGIR